MYHHLVCTSIYRQWSYPFRSLVKSFEGEKKMGMLAHLILVKRGLLTPLYTPKPNNINLPLHHDHRTDMVSDTALHLCSK